MGTSDTFKTVIDAFRHYHIHSVPVIRTQEHLQGGQVVGFIDMLDIATIVARSFPCGRSLTEEEADKLSECTQQLGNTPAWGLINACHKDLHFSIHQDHSVTDALDVFTKGIHRVTIFDDSKHLIGICSQMDVIKCLQAAHKMACTGAKAIAIVAPEGHIIGNFSATDLINAMTDGSESEEGGTAGLNDLKLVINLFLSPLEEFLTNYSPSSLKPLLQLPSSSLADTCKLLITNRIHQVWVVEDIEPPEARKPLGVVTLTDICRMVGGMHWPGVKGYMPAGVHQPRKNMPSTCA